MRVCLESDYEGRGGGPDGVYSGHDWNRPFYKVIRLEPSLLFAVSGSAD